MDGLHLTADLRGCPPDTPALTDLDALRALCLHAVQTTGLQAVGELFHRFPAPENGQAGLTGVVLLAESHLAVHTWPELGAVTLDAYVCNLGGDNRDKAHALIHLLCQALAPREVDPQQLERGRPGQPRRGLT